MPTLANIGPDHTQWKEKLQAKGEINESSGGGTLQDRHNLHVGFGRDVKVPV